MAMLAASTLAPANAGTTPVTAKGSTAITLGGKAITTLQSNGCGALTATAQGDATAFTTAKGGLKIVLKVNAIDVNTNNVVTLYHSGGVVLENSCYTIALKAFRIIGFGTLDQSSQFDLNANVKVDGTGIGREVIGTLDLSEAQIVVSGTTTKVNQANLLASPDGATLLNQLATGDVTGQFAAGDKVGFAKSKVVITGM
jgi:hypothetical protein